jgi:hypothetical protein
MIRPAQEVAAHRQVLPYRHQPAGNAVRRKHDLLAVGITRCYREGNCLGRSGKELINILVCNLEFQKAR